DQFQVKYAGLENVDLDGGSVPASYAINGFKGTALSVYTGTDDDLVQFGAFGNFKGSVSLQDRGGVDTLEVSNTTVTVDTRTIGGSSGFSAYYAAFENLHVNMPAGNTYVEVRGLVPDVAATISNAAKVRLG